MELYVKMTDEELLEYQDYIKHKEDYVKKSDIGLYDILTRDYDNIGSNYDSVFDAQVLSFKHKTRNIEISVREYDWRKRRV